MKRYATFIHSKWAGYYTLEELATFTRQFANYAMQKKAEIEEPHIIYAYYDYSEGDDKRVYHFDLLPKTEDEFDKISTIPNYYIYALHR